MDTRATSLIEMNKQLEELNTKHAEEAEAIRYELTELKSGIDFKFTEIQVGLNEITGMLTKIFPKDPQKQPLYLSNESILHSPTQTDTHQSPPSYQPPKQPPDPQNHLHQITSSAVHTSHPNNPSSMLSRASKVSFPHFDGSQMRDWMYKCEQFFTLDNTPMDQRVQFATIHMSGKALKWHHNYIAERYGAYPSWSEYVIAIAKRFDEPYADPLSELVQLKQGNDLVDIYLEKFECAQTRLSLPPSHAFSIFLANLNPQLDVHVRQFHITIVDEAARLAKLHETYLTISQPTKHKSFPYSTYQKQPNHYKNPNTTPYLPQSSPPENTKPTFIPRNIAEKQPRKFSYEEMQDRKNKGMCMFCDDKYTPGHHLKHRKSHIYVMEAEDDDYQFTDDDIDTPAPQSQPLHEISSDTLTLSLNAINGSSTFNCMRLMGHYGKKKINLLIDPGSTHNFLDSSIANDIGIVLQPTTPMAVTTAHEDNIITFYKCDNFEWSMQGYSFHAPIRVLPLVCCDFVLGVQWLSTLGPIIWDFSNLRMEFTLANQKYVLRGSPKSNGKLIKGSTLNKLLSQSPQLAMLQVREVNHSTVDTKHEGKFAHVSTTGTDMSESPALKTLIASCSDIFDEPTALPPFRKGFVHSIPLVAGSNSVNKRPYI